ncbi:hypothetical protein H8B09_26655 [Paenibacillus sp. PR3]|uniref:Lipoprotein n=1 Tax=Paenibacillus terricola TaxID=2763503 RepID=A0ABR8N2G7_9BACL|nr:hypothetical protein [Paenibacillus terricola]MBD3922362.1 hypothetical protein [Paenibacillus terricola]
MKYPFLIAISLILISGCADNTQATDDKQEITKETVVTTSPTPEPSTSPPEQSETTPNLSLFNKIEDYDPNSNEIELKVNEKKVKTAFSQHDPYPFGFYLPSDMKRVDFEDGIEFHYGKSIFKINYWADSYATNVKQEAIFQPYSEYVGTDIYENEIKKNTAYQVYFAFEKNQIKYVMQWNYFEKDRDTVIPLFTAIATEMRYIPE